MTTIFGLESCDTCKKARNWLTRFGVDHQFIDYRANRVAPETLKAWAGQLGGWEKLINKASTTWRQLPEARKTPGSDPEWTLLIKEYPALVKRPVVVTDDGVVSVGFTDNAFKLRFGEDKMSDVLALTQELIARRSVTPNDEGCQELLASRLAKAGFRCQHLPFGDVKNLFATHGSSGPVMAFLGHTDVVPTGPREQWSSDPFVPEIRDGYLYGRGAADMKGSVAAFVIALEDFVAKHPDHPGTVAVLITSDEEGDAIDGVRKVAEHFRATGQRIDYCLTGEPSSIEVFGDLVRVGRRGTLSGTLTVKGIQGHVAYPERARNPIHQAMVPLAELCARVWDDGYPEFPRSSFQISNIHAGTGANNVIPGSCEVVFNFRYNPGWQTADLENEVHAVLDRLGLDYEIKWHRGGEPFLTRDGPLRRAVRETIIERLGVTPEENTGGGTSDARFIAPLGAEVVEMGPINASIHKVDERVLVADLEKLPDLFREFAERLLL